MIKRTKEHNKVWKTKMHPVTDRLLMICQNSEPEFSLYPESLPKEGTCNNWVEADNKGSYVLCWACCQRMISV